MHSLLASRPFLSVRPVGRLFVRGLRQRRPQDSQIQPEPSEVCGTSFAGGVILRYERRRTAAAKAQHFVINIKAHPRRQIGLGFSFNALPKQQHRSSLTEGQRTMLGLIGVNSAVFLLWRIPNLRPFMYRYFASSFYGEKLLSPMLLSVFSHMGPLHLACNIFFLLNFMPIVDRRNTETFLALFVSGGVISSFAGHVFQATTKARSYTLGAAGGALCCLMYCFMNMCAKTPDAHFGFVFFPFFTFTAAQWIMGILALDTAGLLLGWRLFDHAAHLGGSLAGLAFACWGEKLVIYTLQPHIVHGWKSLTGR